MLTPLQLGLTGLLTMKLLMQATGTSKHLATVSVGSFKCRETLVIGQRNWYSYLSCRCKQEHDDSTLPKELWWNKIPPRQQSLLHAWFRFPSCLHHCWCKHCTRELQHRRSKWYKTFPNVRLPKKFLTFQTQEKTTSTVLKAQHFFSQAQS